MLTAELPILTSMQRSDRFLRPIAYVLSASALLLGACSSDQGATGVTVPTGPTGGWLTVRLTTPRTDDGAVQLSVTGPRIDSMKIVTYDGFDSNSGVQADLVATGNITSGDVARIYVPDLSRTTEYHVSVTAAAARDTYSLQPLDGYRAVLIR